MTLELKTSPEAEEGLLRIWLYIAEDQPVNADRYLNKLRDKILKLVAFSDLGRDRPELAEGLAFLLTAITCITKSLIQT